MRGTRAAEAREFEVSRREIALLQLFTSREGQVLDRFTIMDEVWGVRYEGTTRTLDQHIAGLRKKVEKDPVPSPAYHDGSRDGLQVHRVTLSRGAAGTARNRARNLGTGRWTFSAPSL